MVSDRNRMVLWARAGGRCQYEGCNRSLIGDLISGHDTLNAAYVAHIVAEKPGGPRGDPIRSPLLADDIGNLMLMCDTHHRLIDREAVDTHPEPVLLAMKEAHERRVGLVTGIAAEKATHVVLFGSRIGAHDYPVSFELAKAAMLPERYPAEPRAIELNMANVAYDDSEPAYWALQAENLTRQFGPKVRDRFATGEIGHVSVFALAPQPLLMLLGHLFSDIAGVSVHQLHREPPGWRWRDARAPVQYTVTEAAAAPANVVALKLSLSATITDARISAVLGDAPIWSIAADAANNDIMHRSDDLAEFRRVLRRVFNDIKSRHGENAVIHIFPAVPISAAIEVGRVWMPKADLPLVLYDQNRTAGGFVARLNIPQTPAKAPQELKEISHA